MTTAAWRGSQNLRDIPEVFDQRAWSNGISGNGMSEKLAQGLGWFSIGLGLSEVFAPGALAQWLGLDGKESLLRAFGLREIGAGAGILASHEPDTRGKWVWGRVAGDVLDLAALSPGLSPSNPQRANAIGAIAAVAGITVLDVIVARMLTR